MISRETFVDIAAAGEGSRLRPAMLSMGFSDTYPKHLLPTGNPDGETLLGRIVRQSLELPLDIRPVIHANAQNRPIFAEHVDISPRAHIITSNTDTSFGPFMRRLVSNQTRTLGASGDHYAEVFSWEALLNHHDSDKYPVTIVTAQCSAVDEGAVFDTADSGQITNFRRVERTRPDDTINIGLYVFEPSALVLSSLARVGVTPDALWPSKVSPETIVTSLIEHGLVGAYELPPNTSFNVNTPETYNGLLLHTAANAPAPTALI